MRSCRLPGVAFECFRSLRQLSLLIWGTVLVPPRGEIEKIAARRQISARGGHNHVSTRYSWLVRGQFDPCGSNGDDSEAWLHHWLLPVAEQTRKLGKLRDFLEIFLSPSPVAIIELPLLTAPSLLQSPLQSRQSGRVLALSPRPLPWRS